MQNNFFDICVQVTVLSHFVDSEDQKTCVRLVNTMLGEQEFQEWTKGIDPKEVDHTATLFVNRYGPGIVTEITDKLPKAMQTLMSEFEYLDLVNDIAKKELQHQACEEMYQEVERRFKCMLGEQKKEIDELKWEELSRGNKKL